MAFNVHRSGKDYILAGVCGGIAEATSTSAWVRRLLFYIGNGAGIPLYILLALVLPPPDGEGEFSLGDLIKRTFGSRTGLVLAFTTVLLAFFFAALIANS